ncbi:amidohydrolase family protein [Pedobacter sp. GR22-6]|uniref:amidohydrolase family protein n=1 Tax=Pedobacter sp. GR22-6 TaxID=3127957 RepID=UPI00307D43A8
MLRIDAHQHFWNYDPLRDSWITEEMQLLRNDFRPADLEPILQQFNFEGCVVVQSDQSALENDFQLRNAEANPFIRGIVGWVDLQADDLEAQLAKLKENQILKGFRHILQGETDRALMLRPAFRNGISLLNDFGFTYDLLVLPDQLKYAAELAAEFPEQAFVLDHMAKPEIKLQKIQTWQEDMEALSTLKNVYCKVSGMVTEADWKNWKPADLTPYLDVVFGAFGAERLMYGSDWPVSLLAASYGQWLALLQDYVGPRLNTHEQELFWGGNASKFYDLK